MRLLDCLTLRSYIRWGSQLPITETDWLWGGSAQQDTGSTVWCGMSLVGSPIWSSCWCSLHSQGLAGYEETACVLAPLLPWTLCWANSSILQDCTLTSKGSHIREGWPTRKLQFSSQTQPLIQGRKWSQCPGDLDPHDVSPFPLVGSNAKCSVRT